MGGVVVVVAFDVDCSEINTITAMFTKDVMDSIINRVFIAHVHTAAPADHCRPC